MKMCLVAILVMVGGASCVSVPSGSVVRPKEVKRIGMVVGIKPEKIDEYKKLHADAWPGVLKALEACNLRNFSIYLSEIEEGKHVLFGYVEYWGNDFDADMAKAGTYEINKKWWKLTDACQTPVPMKKGEGLWMNMEEVFHHD